MSINNPFMYTVPDEERVPLTVVADAQEPTPEVVPRKTLARQYADALIAGETLNAIGVRHGVSRERIRQIVAAAGLTAEVDAARKSRQTEVKAAREVERERLAVERKLAVNTKDINRGQRWTDEDIIEQLRGWLAAGGSGTSTDWRISGFSPSAILIARRIGWAKAIRLAGGTPTREVLRPRSDRVSKEDCLAAVVAFLSAEDEKLGGISAYTAWAVPRGLPSGVTVRVRWGTWAAAKQAAVDVLRESAR